MKILLIDDDRPASRTVERGLGRLGFEVELAHDGRTGLRLALGGGHDAVLLDLLLPEVEGIHVLEAVRERRASLPVLVLSALDGIEARVRALNAGADDFLLKPFRFEELEARLRALLRRTRGFATVLEVADLRMDLRTRRVERGGDPVSLTAKEFELLGYLARNHGAVVTRAMIAEHVWGQHFGSLSNVIDVYVRYLRAKIDAGRERSLIHTLRGVGYVLSEARP